MLARIRLPIDTRFLNWPSGKNFHFQCNVGREIHRPSLPPETDPHRPGSAIFIQFSVHQPDPVGHPASQRRIMRNDDDRDPLLAVNIHQ